MAGSPAIFQPENHRAIVTRLAKSVVGSCVRPNTLAAALDRISELEECITQLMAQSTGVSAVILPPNFGFSPAQEILLTMLLTRPIVSREQFYIGLYGFDVERDPKIVDVQICKMRPRLEELGVTVQTAWGRGWMLSAGDKARLRDIIVFFGGSVNGD